MNHPNTENHAQKPLPPALLSEIRTGGFLYLGVAPLPPEIQILILITYLKNLNVDTALKVTSGHDAIAVHLNQTLNNKEYGIWRHYLNRDYPKALRPKNKDYKEQYKMALVRNDIQSLLDVIEFAQLPTNAFTNIASLPAIHTQLTSAMNNATVSLAELIVYRDNARGAIRGLPNVKNISIDRPALIEAAIEERYDLVKTMLALLGGVNAINAEGKTPLMLAVRHWCKSLVELLLKTPGIKVNVANSAGWTALTFAAFLGYRNLTELLVQAPGIDLNAKGNQDGLTALMIAAFSGHKEVVELLLKGPGIDVNAEDNKGKTALALAEEHEHTEIAQLLRDASNSQKKRPK